MLILIQSAIPYTCNAVILYKYTLLHFASCTGKLLVNQSYRTCKFSTYENNYICEEYHVMSNTLRSNNCSHNSDRMNLIIIDEPHFSATV